MSTEINARKMVAEGVRLRPLQFRGVAENFRKSRGSVDFPESVKPHGQANHSMYWSVVLAGVRQWGEDARFRCVLRLSVLAGLTIGAPGARLTTRIEIREQICDEIDSSLPNYAAVIGPAP